MTTALIDHRKLCADIGYNFNNPALIDEALTHPSTPYRYKTGNYERLEFLGDRVLGLVIADLLFHHHRCDNEGELAKRLAYFVSKEFLLGVAKQLQLDKYVRMGRGVSSYDEPRRQSLLADVCEAIIAALYLDGNLSIAQKFIHKYWWPAIVDMTEIPKDAKSTLQEWAQQRGKQPPTYTIIDQQGQDHMPIFTIEVIVEGLSPCHAQAPSRRQAEQLAASLLLKELPI